MYDEARQLLNQAKWRIIDQTALGMHFGALQSFGIDDTLCEAVGSGKSPATARAWVHNQTIVLGIHDTKLPHLQAGLNYLENQQYTYIVRNSGGLAVVLDEGVLNLTLVFPEIDKGIDINRGYQAMWHLIKTMFADFPQQIEAREIRGSYCPGSFDLSINGRKFAGISQRRLKKGVAVQIYLCVTNSGAKRAELVKQFYTFAKNGHSTKFVFPDINPEVMASLSELLTEEFTITEVMVRFLQALKQTSGQIYSGTLTDAELPLLSYYYQRVVERNRKMLADS
jgi:octanoyl-[GcvH]:protein N-octanoyltransferase